MESKSTEQPTVENNKRWFDVMDLEIMFVNAIAICALLLAIVAADLLMT